MSAIRIQDAREREHLFETIPQRIVSLVPSITETLFELGCGDAVAGVTEFCIHPAEGVKAKAKVGGTKNPNLVKIQELRPDLVLANREENRRRDVERLEASGVPVFVTYARTVGDALDEMRMLGDLMQRELQARAFCAQVLEALDEVRLRAGDSKPRVVALIWKRPYMAVGGDTFAHDMLVQSGGQNPFAEDPQRYPRIDEERLTAVAPQVILLPTEPYAFDEGDRLELLKLDCPASRDGRVHVVEGELLSWYGPRMARALRLFSDLIVA